MLKTLDIKDFALIEQLHIEWTKGLNVLTGETGAGKSIIIDTLNAVLGGRAGAAAIRPGSEKAYVEGCFTISPEVGAWLKSNELSDQDGACVIVSREINKSGSRSRINGTLVNHSLVQDLAQILITIHAQHEARTLLSSQAQLHMLDSLGSDADRKLLDRVRTLSSRRRDLLLQLRDLKIAEDERINRLSFIRFQLSELDEARLVDPNEDEELAHQERILANVAQLGDMVGRSYEHLQGEGDRDSSSSAVDLLQSALCEIEKAARLDGQLSQCLELIAQSAATAEEAASLLRRYQGNLESDPEKLALVGARLAVLSAIKRKYGPTVQAALDSQIRLNQELDKLENVESLKDELTTEISQVEGELESLAQGLSQKRRELAANLSQAVLKELGDLGMERCQFQIRFESLPEVGSGGLDRIDFLIAPNPGQPLMPLAKIASGGELSRIMLAIKTIFASADQVATVIFDEIDTGLSGRVLQSMRDKLASLAKSHQILCITHQPIIAASADNHIQIHKLHSKNNTHIAAASLDMNERLKALAAMASGQEGEEVALNFARSLLDQAGQLRS